MKYLLILLFSILSTSTFSADYEGDYKCTVVSASRASEKGVFEGVNNWNFYIDEEFVVERNSGLISGSMFKNREGGISPEVYDHEINGYSVVSSTERQVVNYLQINNFVDGGDKPFIYIMTNVVLSGTCSSY